MYYYYLTVDTVTLNGNLLTTMMMGRSCYFAGLILVILAGSGAVPVNDKDDSLDNYIRAVLDMFRSQMPTGIPDLGIPVLDPFDVPHFNINHIS